MSFSTRCVNRRVHRSLRSDRVLSWFDDSGEPAVVRVPLRDDCRGGPGLARRSGTEARRSSAGSWDRRNCGQTNRPWFTVDRWRLLRQCAWLEGTWCAAVRLDSGVRGGGASPHDQEIVKCSAEPRERTDSRRPRIAFHASLRPVPIREFRSEGPPYRIQLSRFSLTKSSSVRCG